jgi:hypothetical protein
MLGEGGRETGKENENYSLAPWLASPASATDSATTVMPAPRFRISATFCGEAMPGTPYFVRFPAPAASHGGTCGTDHRRARGRGWIKWIESSTGISFSLRYTIAISAPSAERVVTIMVRAKPKKRKGKLQVLTQSRHTSPLSPKQITERPYQTSSPWAPSRRVSRLGDSDAGSRLTGKSAW